MITLLLIYSLTVRAQLLPGIDENTPSSSLCRDIDTCRTRWNIIWSCLTTIFVCTWGAIHPHIPEPVDDKRGSTFHKLIRKITCVMRDKVPLFVCAVLIPEYLLVLALRQRLMVRKLVKDNADLCLTTAHGFFIIMGGFHYFKPFEDSGNASEMTGLESPSLNDPSNPRSAECEARPVHPLTHTDVIAMVRKKQLVLPLESEIQDRGKTDWFAKTIILFQTLWFVTQTIARGIEHLPTTQLEIVALAYITVNFGILIAWWDKPHNVDRPIRVFQRPEERNTEQMYDWWDEMFLFTLGARDHLDLHHRRKVPIFYSGKPSDNEIILSDLIMLAIGVLFGAVHCIAWSFEFSSSTQALVWRVSSLGITCVPFVVFISFGIFLFPNCVRLGQDLLVILFVLIMVLSLVLYVACRFATLVIVLRNLSSLPLGALQAVYWTTLIPHV